MKKYIPLLILGAAILLGVFPCPIYGIFGIPCPTCGITRAWRLFLRLDAKAAIQMHPLFLVPLVFLVPRFQKKWMLVLVIALFLLVYAVRILTQFPSDAPMNFNYDSIIGGFLR